MADICLLYFEENGIGEMIAQGVATNAITVIISRKAITVHSCIRCGGTRVNATFILRNQSGAADIVCNCV